MNHIIYCVDIIYIIIEKLNYSARFFSFAKADGQSGLGSRGQYDRYFVRVLYLSGFVGQAFEPDCLVRHILWVIVREGFSH